MLDEPPLSKEAGEVLLTSRTDALLGPPPHGRTVRIMVTMPSDAGSDYLLVRALIAAGMDCMRINCAHDDQRAWAQMCAHLARANRELKQNCRLAMDIAGPKLRTGGLRPGPSVIKIKPQRDAMGAVRRPAVVALVFAGQTPRLSPSARTVLTLEGEPFPLATGDEIEFSDARGKTRRLRVRTQQDGIVIAELDRTAYVVSGTLLRFSGVDGVTTRPVVNVPPIADTLVLKKGETLLLTAGAEDGRPALRDDREHVLVPAQIGITLPEVFHDVQPGHAAWFDDGKIGGIVRAVSEGEIAVEITHAKAEGSRLGAGKGVNLPDTDLRLPALTAKDLDDIRFVAAHADLVGYSFVRRVQDIYELQERLATLQAERVGIILKIETRRAFTELPKLLLACMRGGQFGVMIARGDLAVECGFERLAEIQEEILWICEAAHTPVIWATQVLETLAKTGQPSRPEVSDAALSERAECVMLNKGPFITEAVVTLDDILRRMQAHQSKKRAMLRPLQVAHAVLEDLRSLGRPSANATPETMTQ